jgi:hypothetical protein
MWSSRLLGKPLGQCLYLVARLSTHLDTVGRAYSNRGNWTGAGRAKMANADLRLGRSGRGRREPDPNSVRSQRARERAAYDVSNKIQLYSGLIGRQFHDSDDLLGFVHSKLDRNLQYRAEFARVISDDNP